MPIINMKEAEMCQAIRLTNQFSDPLAPLKDSEYEKLKHSIEKIGQQKPVILWANLLVEGYHRYKAIKELDIMTIDIERKHFNTAGEVIAWRKSTHKNRTNESHQDFRVNGKPRI